jgi:hypothetical protein
VGHNIETREKIMKILRARSMTVASLLGVAGLLFNVNCGSSSPSGTGTGGTGGSTTGTGGHGGTTGSGGAAAGNGGHGGGTGGTAGGTGGAAGGTGGATGGAAGGTGGATGGAAGGTGGATGGAAGGTAGAAGHGGAGGAGTGGAAGATSGPFDGGGLEGTSLATFDPADGSADLDGFVINIYNNGPGTLDVATDGGAAATLSWTGSQGDPAVGALEVNAPFKAYKEFVDLQKVFPTTALVDWTGKTKLHVRAKVASGLNPVPNYPPGIQPYTQSYSAAVDGGAAAAYHNCSKYTSVPTGNGWNEFTVDLTTCAAPFDLSKIIEFGVEIQTGDGAVDAGTIAVPTPAIVYIDSFSIE